MVSEGEFVTMVVPSGCGNSMLPKSLAGSLRPSGGEALLRGTLIAGLQRNSGVVFQSPVDVTLAHGARQRPATVSVQRPVASGTSESAATVSRSSASRICRARSHDLRRHQTDAPVGRIAQENLTAAEGICGASPR